MKLRLLATGFVLGVSAALITAQALSQDHNGGGASPPQPSPQDTQQMMQAWMESIKPGPQHQAMHPLIGEWESHTEIYEQGPDAPPIEITGKVTRRWVLGQRFMLEEMDQQMMLPGENGEMKAMPWNGMGLFGYDKARNMYVGCWADSMGTQLLTMKGSASPDGKTFSYYGEMDEPQIGVYGREVNYVATIIDDDHNTFQIYDLHAGHNYKVVETTYTRKK